MYVWKSELDERLSNYFRFLTDTVTLANTSY